MESLCILLLFSNLGKILMSFTGIEWNNALKMQKNVANDICQSVEADVT